jgi:hypothetical protein
MLCSTCDSTIQLCVMLGIFLIPSTLSTFNYLMIFTDSLYGIWSLKGLGLLDNQVIEPQATN